MNSTRVPSDSSAPSDSSVPSAAAATTPAEYLARAVALATDNVRNAGGPFGAIIVSADGRVFEGVNRVTANLDPSAHAEVTAIRNACQQLGTFDLSGATLYTSCEPCPMCLATSLWARIDRVYFAANRDDAADAGFDDAVFYRYFEGGPEDRVIMPVSDIALPPEERVAPFTEWSLTTTRIEY
ncbi:nucleoside deaminase [Microbacterium azadirachtae]|uniref:nucleoside deaminase n=1 Tax=Microbacterium azadirachtae TaxID=582680 RepID=UPI00088486C8|nr:nucleoside deaminase [Microbacterium azadirachtae]SDL57390.1 guanine deaminase [Microbacterium azadirachtae]SEF86139.1 guanine deaminase [Microbacterium azadirachtae]SEF88007.1 guanine deaminase [Microbacterium azadirachtae]